MANLDARVELLGLPAVRAKFAKAPAAAQAEAIKVIQAESTPMLAAMKAATFTPIQRRAARTVVIRRDRFGVEVAGAAAGDPVDRAVYYGGEYGGRKTKKVTYASRSPRGKAYVVRRRTTMQFLVHLGREGYWLWPQVRIWLPKINKAIGERVAEVLS